MPVGRTSGYSFRYFNGGGKYIKKDIITKLKACPEASAYLPEDTKLKYLTRYFSFYVSIIYNIIGTIICCSRYIC